AAGRWLASISRIFHLTHLTYPTYLTHPNSPFQYITRKRRGLKHFDIVNALARANQLHRQTKLLLEGDDNAAFGAAVELREDQSSELKRFAEGARLRDRVLADGRVENQQRLMRRALDFAGDDTLDFLDLQHQVGLRVEPAGTVDNDDVGVARARGLDRVERDRCGIGARLRAHELAAHAFRPD